MKVKIKVHPNSSQEKIKKIDEDNYEIWIKEKPKDNKGNKRLLMVLKKYFGRNVEIKSGFNSRNKIVEI